MAKILRKVILLLFVIFPIILVIVEISQKRTEVVTKSCLECKVINNVNGNANSNGNVNSNVNGNVNGNGNFIDKVDCQIKNHRNTTKLSDSVYFFFKDTKILEQVETNDAIQGHFLDRKRMLQKRYQTYLKTNLPVKESGRLGGDLISIVSADGQFFWSHLFKGSDIVLSPKAAVGSDSYCPVNCELSFKYEEKKKSSQLILSWATHVNLDFVLAPWQRRIAIGLETDGCFWMNPPECLQLYDILIGYPRWSEVQVNYWYAVEDRRVKLGLSRSDDLFFMGRKEPYQHPIWPGNSSKPQAVTFISNCGAWQRNLYVEKLQEYGLLIDHFGGCSFSKDRKTGTESKEVLQAGYPFILAFENSLLDDYVTEKYFQGLMNERSIMVYMGSRNLNETLYAPVLNKRYFIHALDYTPRQLYDHLVYLLSNSNRFQEYLEWHFEPKLQSGFGVQLAHQNFVNITGWVCRTCLFARQNGIVT